MNVYLASSWKNESLLKNIKEILKENHTVDLFCDQSSGRFIFSFDDLGDISDLSNVNIHNGYFPDVNKAFREDRKWLDWCDVCIMVLPCGKSAHLEAGYVKGNGKPLIIFAPLGFPLGDVDVMYGFANYICDTFSHLKKCLMELKK